MRNTPNLPTTVDGKTLRKLQVFGVMVNFDNDFRARMQERMRRFSKFDERGNVSSKISVTVRKGDNLSSKAGQDGLDLSWVSDESGPSPLAYFVSSLGMCQMIHYAEHAASQGIEIDDLNITVEGKFSVSRPRYFSEIIYHVELGSPENTEKLIRLASSAASDCYVTNTLSKACVVKGMLTINGMGFGTIE